MLDSNWLSIQREISPRTQSIGAFSVNGEMLEHNPRSSSRFTAYWNGVVLKMDGRHNTGQVLSELLFWPDIEEQDQKFFVPIVGFGLTKEGEVWLAQKEVDAEFGELSDGEWTEARMCLEAICDKYNIWDVFPGSTNGNWMWVDGCPKIYDWGLNPRWNETDDLHDRGYTIPQFNLGGS